MEQVRISYHSYASEWLLAYDIKTCYIVLGWYIRAYCSSVYLLALQRAAAAATHASIAYTLIHTNTETYRSLRQDPGCCSSRHTADKRYLVKTIRHCTVCTCDGGVRACLWCENTLRCEDSCLEDLEKWIDATRDNGWWTCREVYRNTSTAPSSFTDPIRRYWCTHRGMYHLNNGLGVTIKVILVIVVTFNV